MARPLDKTDLFRDDQIEAAIDVALGQDLDTLRRRATIRDKASAEYLPSECLVHLIRQSLRHANSPATHNPRAHALLELLLKRCEANLRAKVSSTIATAVDLREEILQDFGLLFAEDIRPDTDNKLDFFEARFNRAFAFFRIDRVRLELTRLNRLETMSQDDDEEHEPNDADNQGDGDTAIAHDFENEIDLTIFRKQMADAIKSLPKDERDALILHYQLGYKIESDNPEERTVATICKVSGRTIRNRLSRAIAKLSKLREAA